MAPPATWHVESYNTYTGQRSYGSNISATGPGGSVERTAAATAGPEGYGRAAQTTTYDARTGQSNTFGTASVGNNHYADANGNVVQEHRQRLAAAHVERLASRRG